MGLVFFFFSPEEEVEEVLELEAVTLAVMAADFVEGATVAAVAAWEISDAATASDGFATVGEFADDVVAAHPGSSDETLGFSVEGIVMTLRRALLFSASSLTSKWEEQRVRLSAA